MKSDLTQEQKILKRLGVEKRKLLEEYLNEKLIVLRSRLELERDDIRVRHLQGQIKMIRDILKDGEHIDT